MRHQRRHFPDSRPWPNQQAVTKDAVGAADSVGWKVGDAADGVDGDEGEGVDGFADGVGAASGAVSVQDKIWKGRGWVRDEEK